MATVAVVGAGIIGVTTALSILEKDPSVKVNVFADEFSPNTTSDGAAGLLMPYVMSETPDHLQRKWFGTTMRMMKRLLDTEQAPKLGIFSVTAYSVHDTDTGHDEDDAWKDLLYSYRQLTKQELEEFPVQPARFGVIFNTIISEGSLLIPWLMDRVRNLGGVFIKRHIKSLNELSEYDVIVNCAGMGARQLVGDTALRPIRGHVLRIKAPWIKHLYLYHVKKERDKGQSTCIIPQMDSIVIGGTAQLNNFNTNPTAQDTKDIIARVSRIVPSIKNATVLANWAGLRPSRFCVRLEKETVQCRDKYGQQKILNVVHNYGHGGAGLSVGFGCADDCSQLVLEVLASKTMSKL